MIGVGAPWVLAVAAFGALVTCVLHFLSVRRPAVLLLPTMRFLPERPARAVSRSARPSDLLLLLLRVSAILLAGTALSGMTWRGTGVSYGRIVVVQSVQNRNITALREALAMALHGAFNADTTTRLVVLDSTTHILSAAQSQQFKADTLSGSATTARHVPNAGLSAALLAGVHAAGMLAREEASLDEMELVIVAPLTQAATDAALPAVRSLWKGPIRLVDVRDSTPARSDSAALKGTVAFQGQPPGEAVVSAFVEGGIVGRAAPATAGSGKPVSIAAVSVEWPASGRPEGWTATRPDTVGAIVARGEALVWPFVRTALLPDSLLGRGRAVAWWSDGEVAAVETRAAAGCTRQVGVAVPFAGDVLRGGAARALLQALAAPCAGELNVEPLSATAISALEGKGALAPASSFRSAAASPTPYAAVLLVLALLLLAAELFFRDREAADIELGSAEPLTARKVA